MDDFERIVEIRSKRLDRARRKLALTRAELKRAGKQTVDAQQVVDEFSLATYSLEIDLLTSVLHTKASSQTLLMIEEELKKADKQANKLAEQLAEAKRALSMAGEAAEAAAAGTSLAQKRLEKSRKLLTEAQSAERFEADKRDEAEIEEFSSFRVSRSFWYDT